MRDEGCLFCKYYYRKQYFKTFVAVVLVVVLGFWDQSLVLAREALYHLNPYP
jgi:hypothetical protein